MEISNTLDYKKNMVSHSEYKQTRLVQNTGGETLTCGTAANTAVFEIPSVCLNLARTSLDFKVTIPAPAAGNNVIFRDTLPIRRMELLTRGGAYLMDLNNFGAYCHSVLKQETTIKQYQSSDSETDLLVKTGINDLDPQDTLTANTVNLKIRLGDILGTVLAVDKTLFFGEVVNFRVTFAPRNEFGYLSGGTEIIQDVEISDLRLHLAQESNEQVVTSLTSQVETQGMSIMIPYTHSYLTNMPASSSQTVSLRFGRGHGASLEKVYHAVYPNDLSAGNRYDSKVNGKWDTGSFYTQLNNRRQQEYDLNADLAWESKRDYSRGHVISLSKDFYEQYFAWVESWTGDHHHSAEKQQMAGLPLSTEQKWDIVFTMNGAVAYNHFSFAKCQKSLSVSRDGVMVQ